MVKPVIGTGIKLGKPSVKVDHSRSINKSTERLDGTVRNGESVAEYQRRVLGLNILKVAPTNLAPLYHSSAGNFLLPEYVQILRAWRSRGHR